jgi:hypothetical protein
MLSAAYPFIFAEGQFDFTSATASQLREAFTAHTTATGETLGRCMAFLKDAALDADIVVSPFILKGKMRTGGPTKKRTAPQRREEKAVDKSTPPPAQLHHAPPPANMPAQASMLLWGLFQRLPKPGTIWAKGEKDQWEATLKNVLTMEYPDS